MRPDRRLRALLGLSALCAAGVAGFALRRHPSAPLCDEAAAAFCDRLLACGGVARAQLPACVEHHARDCDADVGWRVRRGVRVLDAEAREECLETMQRASCNAVMAVLNDDEQDIFELTEGCEMDELLRPAARLGEPCQLPGDCVEGTCPYAEPGCHACRAFVALGAPCGLGFDQCDPRSAYCAGRRCAALKAAGSPCESRVACARKNEWILEKQDFTKTSCSTCGRPIKVKVRIEHRRQERREIAFVTYRCRCKQGTVEPPKLRMIRGGKKRSKPSSSEKASTSARPALRVAQPPSRSNRRLPKA